MESRIQLCGRIVVTLAGRRVEEELPGRQGRLLFVYLVAHRRRALARAELEGRSGRTRRRQHLIRR